MATLGNSFVDLVDIYKSQDPENQNIPIIEMLMQLNPIVADAYAMECNMGTKHRHAIRTGLPSVAWGKLYQGIPQSKSTFQTVDDTTGFVEGLSSVDTRLLKISPNPALTRLNQATGFLESLNQEASKGIFYYDTADSPEKIKGLAARYSEVGGNGSGTNVIDAGGTGSDNTSMWFVTWGDRQTHLIYPKGTMAGIDREDKGEREATDENGNVYYVERELFTWHLGVAVEDWRYNARICNIDVSDMQAGSVKLYDFMRKAYYKLQSRRVPAGRQVIYCNRDVLEALDALATNAGASDNFVRLTRMEIQGEEVLAYRGIPIRETDALLNTEAKVPAAS